jgi:hypothetical protein
MLKFYRDKQSKQLIVADWSKFPQQITVVASPEIDDLEYKRKEYSKKSLAHFMQAYPVNYHRIKIVYNDVTLFMEKYEEDKGGVKIQGFEGGAIIIDDPLNKTSD